MPRRRYRSDRDERGPWRRPLFLASAAVLALVLLAGLALVIFPPQRPAPAQPAPPASAPPPQAPARQVSCDLPARNQALPVGVVENTSWVLVGTVAAPTSPEHGPAVVEDDGTRRCFARTPTGALFAAVNHLAMTSDPAAREAFLHRSVAPGPGREAALAQAEVTGEGRRNSGSQIAGYAVRSYASDRARVDLALAAVGTDAYGTVATTVVWVDGDWRFLMPEDGSVDSLVSAVPDLTGFTVWSGA